MSAVLVSTPPSLACDLGGTRIKVGVVRAGQVLAQTTIPAHSENGLADALPRLAAAWRNLLESLQLEAADCAGVSMALPHLIDVASGRVLAEFGKYSDAMALDLRDWAGREFGLPLAIENDARMALIGEWKHGAGRGADDVVMITLGTGIGTAAVMQGRVIRGKHGQAAVLGGHSSIHFNGRACGCGNTGCAETEASTVFLKVMAHSRPDYQTSGLAAEPILDFAAVFKHAASGDACALALRDHSLRIWATLAVNLIHAYDPDILVLGGGIMGSADVIVPFIENHIASHANTPWGRVTVRASGLGDQAALVAAEWLIQEQFQPSFT
ncbi:MAG: ROK family protein, partial [Luteolibacter sp.]